MSEDIRMGPVRLIQGIEVPSFFYGTAWKEERTEALVLAAIEAGFRAVDTANQRRHYYEEGVGHALSKVLGEGRLKRGELFLQSKFTYAASQDHRLPYDPDADYATQVEQSFSRTLKHLGTDYLDSFILHGPSLGQGLAEADREVWRAMESLCKSGSVRLIGVSNISEDQLRLLIEFAEIKPAFVQNRCFARTQWDSEVRKQCRDHGIVYQGFSLLTANVSELNRPIMDQVTKRHGCTKAQAVFRFALQLGMIPLTGTSDPEHMKQDLSVYDFAFNADEIAMIENVAA
ncbi:aldo/keto reductase family protein [Methylotuvimicrobium alcaliphilum]|uniref:Aldo/keto reductases n=1 Tax=Methylotuvimicrobium alcaliphilum (strain DSM 19304 / NCIMB 14124 / VKM B-2133 / 20Z) TaxID=1091494 RepID=G4SYI3_META2|nr:aldo/keto reductase [Methylotuvimicrobium alcaliphilum]CCE22187.1 Aldo/keto reductases [Methylotuvimicrobium alcaliphilum 20Z]